MDYLIKVNIKESSYDPASGDIKPYLFLNLEKHSIPSGKFGKGFLICAESSNESIVVYISDAGYLAIRTEDYNYSVRFNNLKVSLNIPLEEQIKHLKSSVISAITEYVYDKYNAAIYFEFDDEKFNLYMSNVAYYMNSTFLDRI